MMKLTLNMTLYINTPEQKEAILDYAYSFNSGETPVVKIQDQIVDAQVGTYQVEYDAPLGLGTGLTKLK